MKIVSQFIRLFGSSFVISVLCSSISFAQEPYHVVYDVDDGLPSDELYDIYVADDNLIWIATDRGISTYDGYDFKTYSQKNGLAYPTNFKVIPDQLGRLWFNGYDGSLSYHQKDSFYHINFSIEQTELSKQNYFNNVGVDSIGNIFAHRYQGSYQGEKPTIYSIKQDGRLEETTYPFDTLGVSETHKITLEKTQFFNTAFYRILERKSYLDVVAEFEDDSVLFAVRKHTNINGGNGRPVAELFLLDKGEIRKVLESKHEITSIFIDSYSNILVTTFNGLLLYREGDLGQDAQVLFENTTFTAITQDHEGNYWAATKSGLLFIPSLSITPVEFGDTAITKITPLKHHLILDTQHEGVYYLKDTTMMINPLEDMSFKNGKYIRHETGLFSHTGLRYLTEDEETHEMVSLDNSNKNNTQIKNTARIRFANIVENAYSVVKMTQKNNSNIRITVMNVDHHDNVWVGTLKGLYLIKSERPNDLIKFSDSIPTLDTRISDIEISTSNKIWISTIGNGIVQIDGTKLVSLWNQANGLSSDIVNQISLEADSVLWVCGNDGLDKVILDNKTNSNSTDVINYSNIDGLLSNYIYDFAFWKGYYWVATSKGLAKFRQTAEFFSTKKPSLKIVSVMANDQLIDHDTQKVLPYNQNDLSFYFTGISYRKHTEGFYSYTLESNKEKPTRILTDYRTIRFRNLTPGNYLFRLKARTKYDVWSDEKQFAFTVKPHYTDTWWFRILCILTSIGILSFIYNRRLKQQSRLAEMRKVEAESHLKSRIADLLTFRNQFNPHFIFNALNSIQRHIMENDTLSAANFLSKFSKLIRQSLNLSSEKYITIASEFNFLENYLKVELLRYPDKVTFEINVVDDIALEAYVLPPLLLQPAIENALKHAFENIKNGKLCLEIRNHKEQKAFVIQIIDNGHWIKEDIKNEEASKRKSFGLKIIHDRIALLNIKYPAVSSSFKLITKQDKSGTIAKFVIPKIDNNESDTSRNN